MELHDRYASYRSDEPEIVEPPRCGLSELAPPDVFDPVIEAYKKDVDRTLLIESLKLTPEQRSRRFLSFMEMACELRRAGEHLRVGRNPKS